MVVDIHLGMVLCLTYLILVVELLEQLVTGGNGTDGKGSGGGGASSSGGGTNYGGNGGDGRVIIRYRIQNTTGNPTADL